ncbi:MAG: InlB B-repeat-containing protein, partial [Candidatus Izemoplasmatales bacterium]
HSLRNLIFITIFTVLGFALLGCNPTGNVIVNFNSMGGNEVSAVEVEIGSLITIPTTEKTGYSFDGWYTSNDNGVSLLDAWSFADSIVETEITLYAKWTVNQYTISIEENGGVIVADLEQDYGTAITAPSLTKEGNTFVGWFQDEELSVPYVFANMEAENITIYAKWQVNEYTITFAENGGSDIVNLTQDYGTAVTVPQAPSKLGHTFVGWYTDSELATAYIFGTMPGTDITIYAKWEPNEFTINYQDYNGSVLSSEVVEFGSDLSVITAPTDFSRVGYTFVGWDISLPITMPAEGITLTAVYSINQYTITFEENGGAEIADLTQDFASVIVAPNATFVGYTFIGWFQDVELSLPFIFTTMPATSPTIYAKWIINEYTINYADHDGTIITTETIEFDADLSGIVAPDNPMRTGYTFTEWDSTLPAKMPANNITITANYTVNQYAVVFEENGGPEMADGDLDYGIDLSSLRMSMVGYLFNGWFQDVELTVPALTMPANNITLYAKWTTLVVSTIDYSFINYSTQFVSETCGTNINMYFYSDRPKSPYVNLSEFIALLSGLIDETTQVEIINDYTVKVFIYYEYTPEEMLEYGLDEPVFTEYVIFDFKDMTVTAPNVDSFDYFSGNTETSFSEGLDIIASSADPLPEFNANVLNYGFTFRMVQVGENTLYTIPLSMANLFLTGSMFDVIINKDAPTGTYYMYGFDTYQAYDIPDAVEGDDLYNIIRANTFDYNNQVTEDSVNFLAFAFDHFYGLKDYKEIESFIDYVGIEFAGYTRTNFYSKLYEFIETFEDLHTSVVTTGHTYPDYTHYQVYGDYPTYIKTHSQAYYDCNCDLATNFTLTIQDNIAYYQITSFTEEFKTEIERDMASIAAANVDYVVLDLSCNGGGVLAGVLNLLNYLTNDDISMYSSTFGADSSWTYDVAGDLAIDAEFFIITSEYTFSAANLFAALATEAGYAKSIGEPSGGGACSIQILVLPNGAIVVMSSPMNLSYSTGETVEEGVPVDYYFDLAGGVPTIEELLIICDELSEETPIE